MNSKSKIELSPIKPINLEMYRGQAVISFNYDDGLIDTFENAIPLHLKYNIPATFSIIANRVIDKSFHNKFIGVEQLNIINEMGFEIASHGFYHKEKMTNLTEKELDLELNVSRNLLEALLTKKTEVSSVCIPQGAANHDIISKAYQSYKTVRLFGYRLNDLSLVNEQPLDAFLVQNTTEVSQIINWIENAINNKKLITLMFHGVDKEPNLKGTYYYSVEKLEEVLKYISTLGTQKIFPSTLKNLNDLSKYKIKSKPTSEQVLVDEEDFMITLHKQTKNPAKKIVITFGGMPSTKTRKGFGTDFILSLGYDTIYVAQAKNTQYQGLSLEDFYKYVSPHLKDKECFTYGSSLGGYCAIYYAGIINAQAISAAPKNSAHPIIGRREYAKKGFLHKPIVDNPISKKAPIIIYDPHHLEESKYIERLILPAYPKARLVKVPFSGHTVLNTMKLSNVLSSFMKALFEEDKIIEFSLKTHDSYIWNAEKGRYLLKKGRKEQGIKYLYKSLEIYPTKEAFEYIFNYYWSLKKRTKISELINIYIVKKKLIPTKNVANKINSIEILNKS